MHASVDGNPSPNRSHPLLPPSSQITKLATKPRPKVVVFDSAAEALNPSGPPTIAVPPPAPQPAKAPAGSEDGLDKLPLSTFESGPSNFFVTPEEAWKVKSVSESKSQYKWTPGHVDQSVKSVKDSKLGKNIMKANDVTSQRVFTFKGAKKVLLKCKEEQVR